MLSLECGGSSFLVSSPTLLPLHIQRINGDLQSFKSLPLLLASRGPQAISLSQSTEASQSLMPSFQAVAWSPTIPLSKYSSPMYRTITSIPSSVRREKKCRIQSDVISENMLSGDADQGRRGVYSGRRRYPDARTSCWKMHPWHAMLKGDPRLIAQQYNLHLVFQGRGRLAWPRLETPTRPSSDNKRKEMKLRSKESLQTAMWGHDSDDLAANELIRDSKPQSSWSSRRHSFDMIPYKMLVFVPATNQGAPNPLPTPNRLCRFPDLTLE